MYIHMQTSYVIFVIYVMHQTSVSEVNHSRQIRSVGKYMAAYFPKIVKCNFAKATQYSIGLLSAHNRCLTHTHTKPNAQTYVAYYVAAAVPHHHAMTMEKLQYIALSTVWFSTVVDSYTKLVRMPHACHPQKQATPRDTSVRQWGWSTL